MRLSEVTITFVQHKLLVLMLLHIDW